MVDWVGSYIASVKIVDFIKYSHVKIIETHRLEFLLEIFLKLKIGSRDSSLIVYGYTLF